jgi:outer membrane receptor protein involved in Fe transport
LQVAGNFNKINNDTPATWISPQRPYEVADYRLDDYQEKHEGSLDVYYNVVTNSNLKYSSRFYYYQNFQTYTFNDDPLNDSTNINTGKQYIDQSIIHTKRIGNVSQVDWALSEKHYALAGFDLKYDMTVGLPDTVLYGRHNAFESGVYIQDEWSVTDKLTLTAGMRLDYYSIINEFTEISFSPKIAFVYSPHSKLSFRGLYAKAYRNPSIAERYIKFEQGGGLYFTPNPDLVSEKLKHSFEVGIKLNLINSLSVDLTLYHNRFEDLISFVQVSGPLEPLTFMVVNLKTATMQGAEIAFNYRPCKWFGLRAGYAFLDAKDTSPDRHNDVLAYKPKHTVSLSTDFKYRNFNLFLSGRTRSKIEEVFIYPDSNPDGYMLLDAKLTYLIKEKHQVYISVNNIQNTQYEELERYRMAGRSFAAGVYLRF